MLECPNHANFPFMHKPPRQSIDLSNGHSLIRKSGHGPEQGVSRYDFNDARTGQ